MDEMYNNNNTAPSSENNDNSRQADKSTDAVERIDAPEKANPANNSATAQHSGQYTYQRPASGYNQQSQYSSDRPQYQAYRQNSAYTYQNGGYNSSAYSHQNPVRSYPATPPYATAPAYNNNKKRSFSFITLIACMIVTAILATVISSAVTLSLRDNNDETKSFSYNGGQAGNSTNTTITNTSDNYVEAVAAKVGPSVIGIVTKYQYSTQNFFGGSSISEAENEGSGVIYTTDGYIITNKHVIDHALAYNGEVYVYLPNNLETAHKAKIIGYDASVDLAVLKIDATNLPSIEIGSSNDLKVGQNAVAVGNPGGLSFIGSVSVGYISGLNRKVTVDSTTMSLIQTDSAINPGNSGGALVDSEGKLIGITNAKLVSEEFEGMGFAIPVDTVIEICDGIIAGKDEPKPYIGVQINTSYTADILKRYGMPEGAVVNSVVEGGPADKAGIRQYDIIVAVGDTNVTSYDILVSAINKHKVGDTVNVRVYRDGDYINCQVTLTANG